MQCRSCGITTEDFMWKGQTPDFVMWQERIYCGDCFEETGKNTKAAIPRPNPNPAMERWEWEGGSPAQTGQ